jgi:hypothetical protein
MEQLPEHRVHPSQIPPTQTSFMTPQAHGTPEHSWSCQLLHCVFGFVQVGVVQTPP